MGAFDLVLFDFGGVLGEIDREGLVAAATQAGVDPRPGLAAWRSAYAGDDADHPLHRAERGEIDRHGLAAALEAQFPGSSAAFDPSSPFAVARMVRPSLPWKDLTEAVESAGIGIAGFTNTFDGMDEETIARVNPAMHAHISSIFGRDRIVESHRLGRRKPSPDAFRAALARLGGVDPSRVLFVDDEIVNCEGARSIGMTAVHCPDGRGDAARAEVRSLLGLP